MFMNHHGETHGRLLPRRALPSRGGGGLASSAVSIHARDSAGSITSSVSSVRATLSAPPRSYAASTSEVKSCCRASAEVCAAWQ